MSLARACRIGAALLVLVVGILIGALDDSLHVVPADSQTVEYVTENITTSVNDYLKSGYKDKYQLVSTSSDSYLHFYIGDETEREGFKATSIGKSRMVIAFPQDMVRNNREGNFHKFDNGSSGYFVTDAYKLFNSFITAKAGTIDPNKYGFNTNKKEFILVIPDNGYLYKKDIIDSFIYIMANGEKITASNADEIFNKIRELLSYATVLSDYGKILSDEDYVGIIPEFMYEVLRGGNIWYPIYYNYCNYTDLTMYTSDDMEDEMENGLIDYFYNDNRIYLNTGFYGKAAQQRTNNMCYTATNIQLVDKQNNFEELFGSNYWKQF